MPRTRKGGRERKADRIGNVQDDGLGGVDGAGLAIGEAGSTGRYLVLFREGAVDAGMQMLSTTFGVRVTSAAEFEASAVPAEALLDAEALVFDVLGVAVVNTAPDQTGVLGAAMGEADSPILAIEEERVVYAISETIRTEELVPALPVETQFDVRLPEGLEQYLRGYQDAVNHLVKQLLQGAGPTTDSSGGSVIIGAETELTWGLQATGVASSRYSGKGVRVAILDTGLDLNHPDFLSRRITSRSFVSNQQVQDGHGHGTHCVGTACGPIRPGQLPRYGVAYDAEIYVGKVLSNQGSGSDGGILAGIEWAINNQCAVISMSLGAPTSIGQSFSRVFETAARRALAAGSLIVAAAGNESERPELVAPVSHPANCPSIMAVAALDPRLNVAAFSCGGLNLQGGQVDIAAPGVAVRSSWPRPRLYHTISGTSMATPHVAGIAALYVEANPEMRGGALGWLLLQSARRLDLPIRDAGAGLVQAPENR